MKLKPKIEEQPIFYTKQLKCDVQQFNSIDSPLFVSVSTSMPQVVTLYRMNHTHVDLNGCMHVCLSLSLSVSVFVSQFERVMYSEHGVDLISKCGTKAHKANARRLYLCACVTMKEYLLCMRVHVCECTISIPLNFIMHM